jgi:hypothetical protein
VLNHSQIRKSKPYFQYSLNEQTSYLWSICLKHFCYFNKKVMKT